MKMGSVIVENGKKVLTMAEYFAGGHLRFVNGEWRDDNGNTIEISRVRYGRWIEPSHLYYGAKQYECSLCCSDTFWKKHSITEKYPHCPNCGAKMDGGDGNSDNV